jgi:hypothetical protein
LLFGRKKNFTPSSFSTGDVSGFWSWFKQNEIELSSAFRAGFAGQVSDGEHADALGLALEKFRSGLVFQIGATSDGMLEFVISADGITERFPAVIELSKAHPASALFKFVAFRQRTVGFTLSMHGASFSAETAHFAIKPSEDHEGKFDLALFLGVHGLDQKQMFHAGFILLDSTIGEYDMETMIGIFEVFESPPVNEIETQALTELPRVLDEVSRSRAIH